MWWHSGAGGSCRRLAAPGFESGWCSGFLLQLTADCVAHSLNLLPDLSVANQRSLKVAAGEPVHHIMTFDPSDRDYLYLMTSNHVRRISPERIRFPLERRIWALMQIDSLPLVQHPPPPSPLYETKAAGVHFD
ncbi:hypothetical protein Z043_105052 [Scleropages formosus]|uniref:Sema domain-containing protein n=1 Tax=Scleropages formosus TaxID=113540 RepID=A0A0P7XHA7_SCLFO|nr:hypothetical protein Z043_105052 [Scleropages formosus]